MRKLIALFLLLFTTQAIAASLTTNEVQLSDPNSGSVLFSDGTQITHDNNNFAWDSSAKRLNLFGSLGVEKLVNGSFTGSSSSWSLGNGWTYSSNAVHHSTNGVGALFQNPGVTIGRSYLVSFTVSNLTVGSVTLAVGGASAPAVSGNGSYYFKLVATTTDPLTLTATNTARMTIDNVSVKELKGGSLATSQVTLSSDTTTPQLTFNFESNYGSPGGGVSIAQFNNKGNTTWIDFIHNNVYKSHLGSNNSGELSLWASGGDYVKFYNKTNTSAPYSTNAPSAFQHIADGRFGGKVGAGASTAPTSTLQTYGSFASKVKRVTASTTLDSSATKWLCDASTPICAGTPANNCASHANEAACNANDAHGGCTWDAGSSCSAFQDQFGMTSCLATSGCSAPTSGCTGTDESTCLAWDDSFGGNCSWDAGASCDGLDQSTCAATTGCTVNNNDCSTFNGNEGACSAQSGCSVASSSTCSSQSDESSCSSAGGCSWDGSSCTGDNSTCSGTYFASCSGNQYTCNGTYYTGVCNGTYGVGCEGTPSCSGITGSTDCNAETGCNYTATVTLNLPEISGVTDRDYYVVNDTSSGDDCVLDATGSDTVDGSSTLTLGAYKDWVHISPFTKTADCAGYNESTCNSSSGCAPNTQNCIWESDACTGNAACTPTNQAECEATTYFASCTGTHIISRNWYKFGY